MKKPNIILQDPTSFTVYDLKMSGVNRRILVLGEVHDIMECGRQTISFPEFIQQYHESIGKENMLDIFSESFYVGKRKLGWLSTLYHFLTYTSSLDDARAIAHVRKRLDACSPKYNFSFYECPENIRVHLCDVRFIREMDYSFRKTKIDCMVDKLFKVGLSYIYPEKLPRVSNTLKDILKLVKNYLFDTKSPAYHTNLTEYILKETKVHKQLESIPSKIVRKKLFQWSKTLYDASITNARRQYILFEKEHKTELEAEWKYVSEGFLQSFRNSISLQMLYVISVYMDMYLAGRLLRDFADKSYAKDAVIYVGEFHARNYRELLKKLGATKIFEKKSILEGGDYASCVDISKFYSSFMKKKKKKTKKTS